MVLKDYQKSVLSDLEQYLSLLLETQNLDAAYTQFWRDKGIAVGQEDVPAYQNILSFRKNQ